ncbi:hypothetical protein A8C32_16220 [Flavivirga aquatica]|uniref:Secretion system C-terminal sorting domain-containing protein n=1 Tax=Flavivirga aquatica TaxID=1849968 RepID=A0A1E5T9E6_9FLAO|nr:T9SS type A sorting domain-containing protein [Flavivirga aquatica]OEK08003.1 hypothetical protein A8C32_16220 [Flavivirga aquatica]
MKKITLLLLFIAFTFLTSAQPITWNFDASNDGWTSTNLTEVTGANALQLTTSGSNPKFDRAAANIPTSSANGYYFASITLRIAGAGPTLVRFGYAKNSNPTNFSYINRPVTNNTPGFVTYYVDFTESTGPGSISNLSLEFKNNDGTASGADFTDNGAVIEIDNISFFDGSGGDEVSKTNFDFNLDYDTDQWEPENAQLQGPMGGILTFEPQDGAVSTLLTTSTYYVVPTNGSNRKFLNITLRNNNSSIDEIRVTAEFSSTFTVQSITTSDTGYKTYSIDLSAIPEWKSLVSSIGISFVNSTTQQSSASGNILIDEISFDRDRLSSSKFEKSDFVALSPNPSIDIINLSSKNNLNFTKLEITDINGRLIKSIALENVSKKEINISELIKGLYFVTIQSENKIQTIKFIKK